MISLRDFSGSSFGRAATRASSGAVSSRIRPFDNAMLIMPMRSSLPASVDPLDAAAQRAQLLLERFVAAVQVIDAVDDRFALRRQAGEHEACRGTQVGCHHLRSGKPFDAFDHRDIAL